jgi:hypothetical protein
MAFSLLAYPRLQRAFGTLTVARAGLLLAIVVAISIPCVRFAVPTAHQLQQQGVEADYFNAPPASSALDLSDLTASMNGSSAVRMPTIMPSAGFTHSSSGCSKMPTNSSSSSSSIGTWAWIFFYFTMLLKAVSGCSAFTSSMILVNALPPSQQLGQVNGVGQSLASLARGLGPGLGGVLWGASVRLGTPGAVLLPYGLVAGTALGGWLIYCFVHMPEGSEVVRGGDSGESIVVGSSCCQK